ncbi:MAG: succinate dehydrogenase cytochrome b subunit [Moheibacter sp.]
MAKESLLGSSIGRKFAMALSGMFLMSFLIIHLACNLTSLFPDDGATYNAVSEFMGYNWIIQYILQPVLTFGIIYHFVMALVLTARNKKARPVKYAMNSPAANSSWMSRNMLVTGGVILAFFLLHFIDFWFPEMNLKYIEFAPNDPERFFPELQHKFSNPIRVIAYVIAFVLLMLHLLHGAQSSFQSVGFNNKKYTPTVKTASKWFAILVPVGFILIAVYHYFNSLM